MGVVFPQKKRQQWPAWKRRIHRPFHIQRLPIAVGIGHDSDVVDCWFGMFQWKWFWFLLHLIMLLNLRSLCSYFSISHFMLLCVPWAEGKNCFLFDMFIFTILLLKKKKKPSKPFSPSPPFLFFNPDCPYWRVAPSACWANGWKTKVEIVSVETVLNNLSHK